MCDYVIMLHKTVLPLLLESLFLLAGFGKQASHVWEFTWEGNMGSLFWPRIASIRHPARGSDQQPARK